MPYEFTSSNRAKFDDGWTKVFAMATDVAKKRSRVCLEVSQRYVEDVWQLDWNDRPAILSRFEAERDRYLAECERASRDDRWAIAVHRIR